MPIKNLFHLQDLEKEQVKDLLDEALLIKRGSRELPLFFGKKPILGLFFLENSTRTKLSFEVAAKRLGAETIDFNAASSSLSKGESLLASFQCLEAFGVDAIVFRGKDSVLSEISEKVSTPIISGGEGSKSHPTQALLDYLSFMEDFGSLEGKRLVIAGDLKHSRVFHSHLELAEKMGVELYFSGPEEFLPENVTGAQYLPFEEALKTADMMMFLRVQNERHESVKNRENYNQDFGLNKERLKLLKEDAKIYHPGPYNLGVEITEEVLQDSRCRIWDQVENGVYLRMAVLKNIFGWSEKDEG